MTSSRSLRAAGDGKSNHALQEILTRGYNRGIAPVIPAFRLQLICSLYFRPECYTSPGGVYLYVVNPDRAPRRIEVTLPSAWAAGEDVWGGQKVVVNGKSTVVTVGDRDTAVIHLIR